LAQEVDTRIELPLSPPLPLPLPPPLPLHALGPRPCEIKRHHSLPMPGNAVARPPSAAAAVEFRQITARNSFHFLSQANLQ